MVQSAGTSKSKAMLFGKYLRHPESPELPSSAPIAPIIRVGKQDYPATVLMMYANPRRCNMPGCDLLHKTSHEFAAHDEFRSFHVDVSHLWNQPKHGRAN